jgi:acyl-CoA thioesterase
VNEPLDLKAQHTAERAATALLGRDRAAQSLGMRLTATRPGAAQLVMRVRADMLNGHATCHGGVIFALADSAFACACNSYDEATVAAAASIDFLTAAREGDELSAAAQELWRTRRNGIYEVVISNQHGERIALFRGRSFQIDGPVVTA